MSEVTAPRPSAPHALRKRRAVPGRCAGRCAARPSAAALGRLSLVVMDPALLNWREVDEILVHKLRFWGRVFFPKPGD